MKKFYKFFMTLVAFAVAGVAQATDYVPEDAIEGIPEEGTQFALQITEGNAASQFLRGIAVSATLDDESIYEFEYVDTDADGNQRVYLKQVASGTYVKDATVDPGLDGNDQWGMEQNIWYTSDSGEAMLLTATIDENGKLILTTQQNNWHNGNGEIAPVYFGVWTIPSIGGWISKAWLPYSVVEQTPYEKVFSYLENNYQGGIEDRYTVGTTAGCVSQEAFDALKAAYDAAFAMTEMGMEEVTAEMAEKAIADLKAAQAQIDASVVPVTPGFYYITNTLFPRQGCFVNGTQIYHDAVDVAAEVTVDQAKFIWEVQDAGNGKFYLRNYYSGTYAGGGNSGVVPSVTEPVAYVIRSASEVVGSGKGFAISDAANLSKGWNRNGGDQLSTTVFWNAGGSDYANSYWNLTAIPQEAISHLEEAIAQDRLNKELQALVVDANSTLNSATYYVSDATQDGNFPNANGEGAEEYLADGIFTSGDQATTNAPEPNEGQPQGLISQMVDGKNGTFFHSTWSGANKYNSDVCLDIDLLKEYNSLTAKLEYRITNGNAHGQGRPFHVTYYGTNDETLLLSNTIDPAAADSASYEGWTELGQTTFSYPYANSDGVAGTVGIAGMPFGDGNNFRYLRMRFTDNNAGATAGWKYVCIAELRLYEATVDPKSPIANVDAAVTEALKNAIAASKAQLVAGTATREQIAALQEALDAFVAVCPDPNTLLNAISDARALVNGAPVGDEVGYYSQEAVDAFKAVIDAVEATYAGDMAMDLINQGKTQLEEATKAFRLALNLPEAGMTYALVSGTDVEARNGAYLRAQNNGRNSSIQWVKEEVDPSMQLNYLWTVEKVEGFEIQLRNVATGLYLNDQNNLSTAVTQTDSVNSREIISANAPGLFNIKIGMRASDGVELYLNTQPANSEEATTGNIVAWTSHAAGADNGAFRFEQVDINRGGESQIDVQAGRLQIISLPYAIEAGENMYRVAGTDATKTKVYCNAIEEGETIAAGEAFIYQAAEEETALYAVVADEFPFTYSQENKNVNGLQALLEGGQAPVGEAIIYTGMPRIATTTVRSVGANGGYITVAATENVVESGDLVLELDGELNAIGNVEISGNAGAGKIYDLSGRRVVKAEKGLYIIGGKKVLVK